MAGDALIELAGDAERALAAGSLEDLDGLEAALARALEAARQFRVQIDLGGRVDADRLLAFEALFRSAVGLQPKLGEVEIDATVEGTPPGRVGALRANAFVVARAVLESLRAGYRVGFETEAKQ